jgi:transmembrane sensor
MNYYQYSAEDFAADDDFKEWVHTPTAASNAFWQEFLTEYPERFYQLEEAKRLVTGLSYIQKEPVSDRQVERIWSRIEDTITVSREASPQRWLIWGISWKVAATIALVAGVAWLAQPVFLKNDSGVAATSLESPQEWTEAVNDNHKTMIIQLSDGSTVHLEKSSSLRYPKGFSGTNREVHLTGAAFFDIQKNPEQPFLVYSNGLVTKVLGTSFFVQAHKDAPDVSVSVRTGRVSVYADKPSQTQDPEANGIVLTPNQKAVYQRKEATISKVLVEKPVLLLPKVAADHFAFEAATASQVFTALEKAYGIEVVYDEELLRHCYLTINLSEENLFQKLEVICKVLGAQYKLIDGQVIIYSKGC